MSQNKGNVSPPEEPQVNTRLAKYIFLDVVQFTHGRSVEAQSHIVEQLNKIVRASLDKYSLKESDCILLPTGDGMCIGIIKPESYYDIHMQVALSILELLHTYNTETKDQMRQFQIRVGLNQNDDNIVVDINGRDNLAGTGINIAARVLSKADGNQILVGQAVYETLQQREKYMGKFNSFDATAKHSLALPIHQYIGQGHNGLNINAPSAFIQPKTEEVRLSNIVAYYLAYAIRNRTILRSQLEDKAGYAGVVLLWFLARDSVELSHSSDVNPPMFQTHKFNEASFEEQLAYYSTQDWYMTIQLRDRIVESELEKYEECFEGRVDVRYVFVSKVGMEKLKKEWTSIYSQFSFSY